MTTKNNESTQQPSRNPGTAPNRDEVQERAYYRYLERGRADGQALDDWLAAETEAGQTTGGRTDS